MEKKIVENISLVFLAILVTITLFELFQIITGNKVFIGEFMYAFISSEIEYLLPFLFYFYLFKMTRKFLGRKNPDFFKIQNQYLLGLGLMSVVMLFIAIVVIVSLGLSLKEIPDYLFYCIMPVVFVPVIISLEYIYERKFSGE